MKKLKHEAELFKGALLVGVKYAEGRKGRGVRADGFGQSETSVHLSPARSRQSHPATARRPSG